MSDDSSVVVVVAPRGDSPQFSSSPGLSSPPRSSPESASPSAQFATELSAHHSSNSSIIVNPAGVVVVDLPKPVVAQSAAPPPPVRKKPGRKPGSVNKPKLAAAAAAHAAAEGSSATNTDVPKTKKPRKPRDPNAPPNPRKKRVASSEAATNHHNFGAADIAAVADAGMRPAELGYSSHADGNLPSQKGKSEDIQRPINSFFNAAPPPPPPQPAQHPPQPPPLPQQQQHQQQPFRTSGQNYDPIRSNYDPVRETVVTYGNSQPSPSHPPSMNRASASPSISSLVDPPNQALTSPSIAAQSFFNQQQQARLHREDGHASVPPSPTINRLAPSVVIEQSLGPRPSAPPTQPAPKKAETVSLAPAGPLATSKKSSVANGSPAASSAAASPKPPKLKDTKDGKDTFPTPPPLPGSGLMQLGGIGGGPSDGTEFRAPTVVLEIPMGGETNKYINFTRLAEERYGWDALHPRLAAQRDRLARVAAAGAALERNGSTKESGDEMSLDSEGEGSNIEMGGMSDGRTGTDGGAKKIPRKRKMKEDEYDKDDGFVDDSELLWEEQAAAANDGFFVYSGPLVPEGEKPALDLRADGAPKRGRGRGSRGGSTRGSGTRGGSNLAAGARASGGAGSRGGTTTRKPRITKADRARMEQEKLEREKMGSMASMPSGYSGMAQLASAANMGNTPMVFNQ